MAKVFSERAQVTEPSTDNFIDVIIAYTTETAANANIETSIEAMLEATNQMLADSCVNFRYRLLDVIATGVSTGTDDGYAILDDFRNPAGPYSAIHTARESQGADLVHLIVDTGSIGLCGLAELGGVNTSFDTVAFGLTAFACPSFVLAHELGHNMSLRHDRYQQDLNLNQEAPGEEHYGFVDTVNQYESIMSYQDHCIENGTFCERLNKFSNPRAFHNGVAFGLTGFADNTNALNERYPFVANYRPSQTSFSPTINQNCATSDANKDLHCFVATATYGSTLHPKINVLRQFRDQVLKKTWMGRKAVGFYYKHSPRWAFVIRNNSHLKLVSQFFLGLIIFAIEYFWIFLTIPLFFLLRKKSFFMVFLLGLIIEHPQAQAFTTITPKDQSLLTVNPVLSLSGVSNHFMGLSATHLMSEGSPDSLSSIEEGGTFGDLCGGYRSPGFAINLRYRPEWDRKTKTQILPLAASEVSQKSDLIVIDTSFNGFFGLPLGVRLNHSTTKDLTAGGVLASETKNLVVNIGSVLRFSNFLVGGGLVYNMDSKTDSMNSQPEAKANWLSLYLGLGFNFSGGGATGQFAGGGSSGLSDGLQVELSYLRDPQVLAVESSNQIVRPEKSDIRLILQYITSPYLFSLQYHTISLATVENFFAEKSQFDQITAGFGLDIGSFIFNSNLHVRNEKTGFKRQEIGLNVAFTFMFSGGGGSVPAAY